MPNSMQKAFFYELSVYLSVAYAASNLPLMEAFHPHQI